MSAIPTATNIPVKSRLGLDSCYTTGSGVNTGVLNSLCAQTMTPSKLCVGSSKFMVN
jgi:hypothetical protein